MSFLINVDGNNGSWPYIVAGIAVAVTSVLFIVLVVIIAVRAKRVCRKRPKSTNMIVIGRVKRVSPSTSAMDSEEASNAQEAQSEHKV